MHLFEFIHCMISVLFVSLGFLRPTIQRLVIIYIRYIKVAVRALNGTHLLMYKTLVLGMFQGRLILAAPQCIYSNTLNPSLLVQANPQHHPRVHYRWQKYFNTSLKVCFVVDVVLFNSSVCACLGYVNVSSIVTIPAVLHLTPISQGNDKASVYLMDRRNIF